MIPGPPPVMTASSRSASSAADLDGGGVVRMVGCDAGRAEDGDGGADARERVEAVHELAEDAQGAPGVGVHERGVGLALQEAGIGGTHALGPGPVGAHPAVPWSGHARLASSSGRRGEPRRVRSRARHDACASAPRTHAWSVDRLLVDDCPLGVDGDDGRARAVRDRARREGEDRPASVR